jgi:RNA ligase
MSEANEQGMYEAYKRMTEAPVHYGHDERTFIGLEFKPFQKIGRLTRGITITEKLDGSNAQITIVPVLPDYNDPNIIARIESPTGSFAMYAGSRTRWITPGKETDNFGFARWAQDWSLELFKLGPGTHYGEWYGQGIQRNYGLQEKRFALFNALRWGNGPDRPTRPTCCDVVPVLYHGVFSGDCADAAIATLRSNGSFAVPGFKNPEGIVVFHHATKTLFKKTLEKDEEPKGLQGCKPPITLDQMSRGS